MDSGPESPISPAEERLVRRGAWWALGLGGLLVLMSLFGVVALMTGAVVSWVMLAGVVGVMGIGGYSLYLGIRARDPMTRRSAHFTALIWLYGVLLAMSVVDIVVSIAVGERLTGVWLIFVYIGALFAFITSRKVLRSLEAEQRQSLDT